MRVHQGEILKSLLTRKGISQTDYAKAAGITRQTAIYRFGRPNLDESVIEEASKILEVTRDVFFEPLKGDKQAELEDLQKQLFEAQKQIISLQDVLLSEKDKNHELSVQCAKLEMELDLLRKQVGG